MQSACGHLSTSGHPSPPLPTIGASWLALEPRIMFDGAAVATVDSVAAAQLAQSQAESSVSPDDVTTSDTPPAAPTGEPQFNSSDQALFDALAAYDASTARQEIVFLSPSVRDYQKLLDGISPNVEVFVLDPSRDGVAQMAEVLAGRTGIDAIHIISHGTQAELTLGTARLTLESMGGAYADELAAIGQSLSAKGDILIYGCNFGQGARGAEIAMRLGQLTGADVAASVDDTGHADLGGDWHLEHQAGEIEAALVLSDGAMREWVGLLAENILESYEPTFASMGDQAYEVKSTQPWGETFSYDSPSASYTVHRIGLVLYRDSTAASQVITASLRSSWNGAVIASGQVSAASLGTTEAWVHIDLTTPATLTDNASYYIRVGSNSSSGKVYVGVRDSGAYANGDLINKDGVSETPKDMAFRIIESTGNAGPVITNLNGDSLAYAEGSGAVIIDQSGNTTVNDVDSSDFDTGALIVSFVAGSDTAEDVLTIRNEGTGAGQIGVSGNDVSYGGLNIGTFAGGSSGANLVVTFNGNATPAAAQALIRNVTYENTDTDNPTTGVRTVRFELTDGDGGSSGNHDTAVTVNGVNDPPVITSNGGGATAAISVGENTTVVTTVTSTDVDGGTAVYSVVPVVGGGAADAAKFTINSSTGALSFVTAPDFENPTDTGLNNVYEVTVRVSDGNGGTDTQMISVSLINHPRVFDQFNTVSYGGNNGDQNWLSTWTEIGESNGTGSGVVRVSSSGYMHIGGDEVTITGRGASRAADLSGAGYAILSFDYRRVDIDGGGGSIILQVSSDSGSNWNTLTTYSLSSFDGSFVATSFDISAYATAGTQIRFLGSGSTEASFRVDNVAIEHNGTVGNNAPVITSDGGVDTASLSVAEIATAGTDVNATDPEAPPQTLTYSLSGVDAARFTIDSNTGVLTFASAPDFENPSDSDTDNVYEVTVQVSDGNGGMDTQVISVTVTNVNEAPTAVVLNNQAPTIAENTVIGAGYKVADIAVTDDALGTNGLSLSGADAADFTIVGTELFYTGASPNFETKSSYAVTMNVNDTTVGGTPDASVNFTLTVTDVNEAPVNTVPGTQTVAEDGSLIFSVGNGTLISISDIDAASGVVKVTLTAGNGTLTLNGTTGLSFITGDGTGDGTMVFLGTIVDVNQALDGMSFTPTLNYNGPASVQITTNDQGNTGSGGPQSDTDAVAITITSVNDPPVNSIPGPQGIPQNGTLIFSTGNGTLISISDVDAASGVMAVALTAGNGTLTLNGTTGLSFSTGDGTGDGTMVFLGTIVDVNQALDGMSFTPTLNYNGPASAQIITDDQGNTGSGGPQGDTDTVSISVSNNVPPVVTTSGGSLSYTENNGAVAIDTGLTATDVDNASLGGATVRITGNYVNGEDLLVFADQLGIIGNWNAATGDLTLTGSATVSDYQTALRSITYTNLNEAPNTTARTVSFVINDGNADSAIVTRMITVAAVNDAPTITNLAGDSLTYNEGDGAVVIEQVGNAAVADVDSADFNTGTLTVSFTAGSDSAEDVLSIRNQGTGAGQISVSGSNVTYGGVTIGTFTGGSSGGNLVITLNSSATPTAVTALAHNITYENQDTNAPTTGARIVRYVLTDGDGGSSADYDTTVTVSGVNDPPVNTVPGTQTVNEDTALNLAGISVNDVDGNLSTAQLAVSNGTVTVTLAGAATISGGLNGSSTLTLAGTQADINATLASLSYQGNLDFNGSDTLAVTSTDSNSVTDVDNVAITLMGVNDPPVNAVPVAQTVNEDTALAISGVSVNDVDGNLSTTQLSVTNGTLMVSVAGGATMIAGANGTNTLTLSGTQGQVNAALATLVYQGTPNYNGGDTLTLTSTDSNSVTDIDTVAITVNPVNDSPAMTAIADQTIPEDGTTGVLPFTVTDAETAAGSLTVTATSSNTTLIPNGNLTLVNLGGGSWTIAATPAPNQNGGPVTIMVTVSDGTTTTNETFDVTVTTVNDAPVGVPTITGTVTEDQTLTAATGGISDVDGLGAFSHQWLRNGVVIGGATASTYVLGDADVGAQMSVRVTYTDSQGTAEGPLTSAQTAAVANVNDAPVATNLNAAQAYALNTTLDLADIVISDVDSATVTVTLTLSDLSAGSFSTGTSGSVTSTYNAVTGVWTAAGAIADVNVLLAGVTYTPAFLYISNFTIATSVDDGVAPAVTGSKSMTSVLVNLPPIATNLNTAETYTEDTPLDLTNIVVTDLDSPTVNATLTLSDLAAGSLSTTISGSVTSTYNAATGIWTASGAIGDVNALLAGVTFTPAPNYNSNFTMSTSADDGVAAPITGVKNMTGTAVNDAPVNTVPGAQTITEDTALAIGGLSVMDVDGNLSTVQLAVTNGTVTVSLAGGAIISSGANGTPTLTLSGTQAQINAALGTLSYQGMLNYAGSDTLTVTSTDIGSAIDVDTVTITVNPVNDAPAITSNGSGPATLVNAAESQTAVTTATSTDVDGGAPTYFIIGGADASLFTLNPSTGVLAFNSTPDFEAPADAGGNNIYDVTIEAADGSGGIDTQNLSITVTDVLEGLPPTLPPPPIPPSLVPQPPAPPTGETSPTGSPLPLPPIVISPSIVPTSNTETPVPSGAFNIDPSNTTQPILQVLAGAADEEKKMSGLRVVPASIARELRGYLDDNVASLIPADEGIRRIFGGHTLDHIPAPPLSEAFRKTLSYVEEDLRQAAEMSDSRQQFLIRAVNMGGFTLTAGVIAWLLRSGFLLASLFATLPAWRHFDPLPVVLLGGRERRKRKAGMVAAAEHENKRFRGLKGLVDKKAGNERSNGGGMAA